MTDAKVFFNDRCMHEIDVYIDEHAYVHVQMLITFISEPVASAIAK